MEAGPVRFLSRELDDRLAVAEKLRILRSHGMTSLTWDRQQGHSFSYDVVALGYNYRIAEMRAAIGMVQLGKLAEIQLGPSPPDMREDQSRLE